MGPTRNCGPACGIRVSRGRCGAGLRGPCSSLSRNRQGSRRPRSRSVVGGPAAEHPGFVLDDHVLDDGRVPSNRRPKTESDNQQRNHRYSQKHRATSLRVRCLLPGGGVAKGMGEEKGSLGGPFSSPSREGPLPNETRGKPQGPGGAGCGSRDYDFEALVG
jgi:hypothetical protein